MSFPNSREMSQLETSGVTNNRQFKRMRLSESVKIHFKDQPEPSGSLSCDISEGGVKINYHDFIPINTEVGLEVTMEDLSVIQCTGRVVWVQKMPHAEHVRLSEHQYW